MTTVDIDQSIVTDTMVSVLEHRASTSRYTSDDLIIAAWVRANKVWWEGTGWLTSKDLSRLAGIAIAARVMDDQYTLLRKLRREDQSTLLRKLLHNEH